eukprot:Gb_03639 [translate_table: standard]
MTEHILFNSAILRGAKMPVVLCLTFAQNNVSLFYNFCTIYSKSHLDFFLT